MVYNLIYKKSVERDLRQISKVEASRIFDKIEQELIKNPEAYAELKGQFAGLRKYRVGNYRVIYSILDTEVIILRIAHRREVYKRKL